MRPLPVPILTFLTFLSSATSIQLHPRGSLQEGGAIVVRRPPSSLLAATTTSQSTSSTSTSSTDTSTSSSFSTSTSSTPSTSSTEIPTSTTDTSSSTLTTTSDSSSSRTRTTSYTSTSSSTPGTSPDLLTSSSSTPSSTTFGGTFTVTAVVSGPSTSFSGDSSSTSSKNGFFANKGAVAGTFLVVGLFGTAFLSCALLWALHKYRRHRNEQGDFDDEYREFNHDRNGTTPEPTLPAMRDSRAMPSISSIPAPDMIERLHGPNQTSQNAYYDPAHGQYRPESGDFDPYKVYDAAKGYPEDPASHAQYTQYTEQGSGPYTYEGHTAAPPHSRAAGPSLSQQ